MQEELDAIKDADFEMVQNQNDLIQYEDEVEIDEEKPAEAGTPQKETTLKEKLQSHGAMAIQQKSQIT